MSEISSLEDIKYGALFLQEQLVGTDPEKVKAAYESFQALVDRFYSENREIISERQYRAARDNYDYFLVLVEMALDRCKRCRSEAENLPGSPGAEDDANGP